MSRSREAGTKVCIDTMGQVQKRRVPERWNPENSESARTGTNMREDRPGGGTYQYRGDPCETDHKSFPQTRGLD